MAKKVLVICGSPHAHSHSDVLAKAFAAGAQEGGNTVEIVKLAEKHFQPCLGCDACRKAGNWECIQNDDMQELYKHVQEANVIALATPLYFLTVSAQLKAFMDRLYCKHHAGELRDKKSVLLSTSGGPGSGILADYFTALCGLAGWENAGVITQGGLGRSSAGPGEEKKAEAFKLGMCV
ncbi:MAG: flavodoxin family protein [Treponema sp.]|nr:flavodoxin family protein [Treponema sp.]